MCVYFVCCACCALVVFACYGNPQPAAATATSVFEEEVSVKDWSLSAYCVLVVCGHRLGAALPLLVALFIHSRTQRQGVTSSTLEEGFSALQLVPLLPPAPNLPPFTEGRKQGRE